MASTGTDLDYDVGIEDPIRPTPDDWSIVPVRSTRKSKKSVGSVGSVGLMGLNGRAGNMLRSAAAVPNARKARKSAKKERRGTLKAAREADKYRWSRSEPEAMEEEYVRRVEDGLARFFRPGVMRYFRDQLAGFGTGVEPGHDEIVVFLREIFRKYRMIVSGGFVLKQITGSFEELAKPSVDADFYISHETPSRHPEFYETMARLFDCDTVGKVRRVRGVRAADRIEAEHQEELKLAEGVFGDGERRADVEKEWRIEKSVASHSGKGGFFKKNGIHSVYKHKRGGEEGTPSYAEMDVVRAVKGRSAVAIVKNFDLSVCMNWYDGKNVWVMDRPGIFKEGVSYLAYSYIPLLLGIRNEHGTETPLNMVTRKRVLKYLLRGFRIQYMDPRTGEMVEIRVRDLSNAVNAMENVGKREEVRRVYGLAAAAANR